MMMMVLVFIVYIMMQVTSTDHSPDPLSVVVVYYFLVHPRHCLSFTGMFISVLKGKYEQYYCNDCVVQLVRLLLV